MRHVFALLVALTMFAQEATCEPNILIITADNLGYGDLRCYNSDSPIQTPHLDRFAEQSVRLTSFYTASPTCTVSRASLLTGRVPQRHGLVNQLPGLEGNYGVGLNPREVLIPQILKRAATPYATGCFGKWNIGFAPGSRPTERGFDEFIGNASGNIDYYHHVYNMRHDVYRGTEEYHVQGTYSTDLFADAAIDFMQRKSREGTPWFCYLPFNAPHCPNKKNKRPGQPNTWQAPDQAFEAYGLTSEEPDRMKRYYAVVTALDEAIGRVMASLEQTGEADNTFVFFYSDNGAFRLGREGDCGINTPLRSGGVTCWEGGLRVAALARWPNRILPGTVNGEAFWSPDLLVTCAKLANAPLPEGVVLDGVDVMPMLVKRQSLPQRSFYFAFRKHAALRSGDWKIVRERPDSPWQLFNLAEDLSEETDRASEQPSRREELATEFVRWESGF